MKKLFLVLISLVTLNVSAENNFRRMDNAADKVVYRAKQEALLMLNQYQNSSFPADRLYKKERSQTILELLSRRIGIYLENDRNPSDHCYNSEDRTKTWGFVSEIPDVIFLCRFIKILAHDFKKVAQVILHEAFHVWETDSYETTDEILAGEFEIDVTMNHLGCVPFRSDRALDSIDVLNIKNVIFCDNKDY